MTDRPNATVVPTAQPAGALLRGAALALLGTLVLVASAKVQVPFYPVPMTLQTLAVLTLGAWFGARLAAATVALYLGEGLIGLPVFAGAAAGPAYLAGPTGGYLVGFLARRGAGRRTRRARLDARLAARDCRHDARPSRHFRRRFRLAGADARRRQGLGGRRRPVRRGDIGQDAARRGAGDRRAPLGSARERRLSGAGEPASEARAAPSGRAGFARFVPLTTRWNDNDPYGHLNNVAYYAFFDAAVNAILVEAGLLDPASSPVIGVVAESSCRFYSALSLSRSGRGRRRGRASRPLVGALSSGGVQGGRGAARARTGDTPMSTSSARPAGRRRFRRRTGG